MRLIAGGLSRVMSMVRAGSTTRHGRRGHGWRPQAGWLFRLQRAGVEGADKNHNQADEIDEIGLRRGDCPPPKAVVRGPTGFIFHAVLLRQPGEDEKRKPVKRAIKPAVEGNECAAGT